MNLEKGQEVEAKAEAKEFSDGLIVIRELILLTALLTYVILEGEYVRTTVDGREMVDSSSSSYVANRPASLLGIFTSVPKEF